MMMLGWTQLAAKSILPGGTERARKSLLSLISSYGATKIPPGVLDVLAAHGFADLAAAAATCSELPSMSDARKKVFQATSGDWDPVVRSLLTEYEESEYYPDHPEEHSLLFHKMVVLARSAELYGRFKHARVLFEAAGAWRELLALCLFQGDFDALQRYGSQGGRRAELIASHLLAVNEDAFRRSVATNNPRCGGRPFVDDHVMGAKGREMAERPATPDGRWKPSLPRRISSSRPHRTGFLSCRQPWSWTRTPWPPASWPCRLGPRSHLRTRPAITAG
jgi:hypothetical protein